MSSTIGNLIHRACNKDRPRYLILPVDNVCLRTIRNNVNADFISLPEVQSPIGHMNFDAVIITERSKHFSQLFMLAQQLHIPLVCYEALLPESPEVVEEQSRLSSPINVFTQTHLAQFWGMNQYHVLTPVLELQKYDEMEKDYGTVFFTTDQNGQEIVNKVRERNLQAAMMNEGVNVQKIVYYVNTLLTPETIGTLLNIMSVGGIVCTLQHPLINEIVVDGCNGIVAKDIDTLKEKINNLLTQSIDRRNSLIDGAKATITKQYSPSVFKKQWASVEKEIQKFVFRGIL